MSSDALGFFEKHRALFEYDKYFPGRDPCTSSSASGLLLAYTSAPSSSSSFAEAIAALNAPAAPGIAFKPPPPAATATIASWTKPLAASRPIARLYEPRPLGGAKESTFPPPLAQQPVAPVSLPLQPAAPLPFQPTVPTLPPMTLVAKAHESSKSNGPAKELSRQASSSNALQRGPQLLDSSVRAYTRKVDVAQKIEMLVGPKFGRVFGPSSNLPLGVKRRLEAYARLDQRKEALYQLLLSEQHALEALRSTRNT
ncbi:hypothetical protein SPRG_17054 [Saprolegnia parasitica CBS 223.65]|uniref:Uncharacterized protein n=1 Tax=Saprolegnia parasitica (strain CBS 223.65) TaxID=695850 RepID=A0A067BTF2_SAPPC|nr:hypothetical protein SPRG_17054 [Saprolegnia parasitica CBS 223.65]KDO17561.1 hypothetical protein SPRG_17054 [Saprolegnia parasitica CBS 223.65]|eukprot:XP_012211728.1 hypothetical protein SPRG_17054 [Saprolegnia parasitica CBS 223.65]